MHPMGRPRTHRKDLPPGLHFDSRYGVYFYRGTRGDARAYRSFGKVTREQAIKQWVAYTEPKHDDAPAGTIGELLDRFLRDEMGGLSDATLTNYRYHLGRLRKLWGERKYAITVDEAVRIGALRAMDVSTYLRAAKVAGNGYFAAAYSVTVLQMVFNRAREWGLSEYNPCIGVRRTPPGKSTRLLTFDEIDAVQKRAKPRMALMIEFAWRTGARRM